MKIAIALILSLSCLHYSIAQPESPQPYFTALMVQNIDTSTQWYSSVLGFEVINQTAMESIGLRQANLTLDGALLELIEIPTAIEKQKVFAQFEGKKYVQGIFKIGFKVANLDAFVTYLRSKNVDFHGEIVRDDKLNMRMIIIKDPDGNYIQFFENN